jgi:ABC-type transport system involved in multi-copper enzyme maturation permease subunit
MRQTLAIFIDAYRELNSRKLFWIVLALSVAVVAALAIPSNNERGIGAFGLTADLPFLSTKAVSPGGFYKFLFSWFGINLWLAWGATILALISTAGMIPEMVSSGAVELVLSKPISRLRLFLTKYAAGLMFVALQATVFAVGAILVIGFRGGVWDARPLMAIPLMVLFFSYLFSVCALVGMLTRSTLLALLATILVWLASWLAASVEQFMLEQRLRQEQQVVRMDGQVSTLKTTLETIDEQLRDLGIDPATPSLVDPKTDATASNSVSPVPPSPNADAATLEDDSQRPDEPPRRPSRRGTRNLLEAGRALLGQVDAAGGTDSLLRNRAQVVRQIERLETAIDPMRERSESTTKWHRRIYALNAVLPKTGETKRLFQRFVVDKSDMEGLLKMLVEVSEDEDAGTAEEALNNRSLAWVIGTSLAFEFVILGAATFIFVRRDF